MRKIIICVGFILISLLSFNLSFAQTYVSGNIMTNTTWTVAGSPYIVTGDITIFEDIVVTIEPGVIVKLEHYIDIIVNGALCADGTYTDSIYFTSYRDDDHGGDTNGDGIATSPAKNDWGRIFFNSRSLDSQCRTNYCRITYGGRSAYSDYGPVLYVDRANPTIINTLVQHNEANGIDIATGSIIEDINLDVIGIPYCIRDDLTQVVGTKMVINPGVIIKLWEYRDIIINGSLTATGTPSDSIYITSYRDDAHGGDTNDDGLATIPTKNNWGRIFFNSNSLDSLCKISFCRIMYGGRSAYSDYGPVLYVDRANPTIINTLVQHNEANGIDIATGSVIEDINLDVIGIPYCIRDDLTQVVGTRMVINPGVVIKLWEYRDIIINGALIATGTPSDSIYITSYKDDLHGGDTNEDGLATIPGENDWGKILFNSSSLDSLCKISFCRIMYGGRSAYSDYGPVLYVDRANPTIINTLVQHNEANGIGLATGSINENILLDILDIPYCILGDMTIQEGFTQPQLTVNPGVVLKLWGSVDIRIDAKMKAVGTPANPIILTSYRDDRILGDTNNDGPTVGYCGDWGNLFFNNASEDTACILDHCKLYFGDNMIYCDNANPLIQNCHIQASNKGVYCVNSASPDLGSGVHTGEGNNSFIDYVDVSGKYAVYNNGTANIFALNNYWEDTVYSNISTGAIYDHEDNSSRGYVFFDPFLIPEIPDIVTGLTAETYSSYDIILTWDVVVDADYYEIWRSSTYWGTYELINSTLWTTYVDEYLTPSTGYYYKVKACNMFGCGDFTTPAYATTTPEPPSDLIATLNSDNSVTLTWLSTTGATSYKIYRSVGYADTFSFLSEVPAAMCRSFAPMTSEHTDHAAVHQSTNRYRVFALTSSGNTSFSNVAVANVFETPEEFYNSFYFRQNSPAEWADDPMYPSDHTIEYWGCAMTCVSMLYKAVGVEDMTPRVLNNFLLSHSPIGYNSFGGIKWDIADNYEYWINYDISFHHSAGEEETSPPLSYSYFTDIKQYIDNGNPVIVRVKNSFRADYPWHWVLITHYFENDEDIYYINDPFYPDDNTLDIYSNNIYSTRLFRRVDSQPVLQYIATIFNRQSPEEMITMNPGETKELVVSYQNIGTTDWKNDPSHPQYVELHSCNSLGEPTECPIYPGNGNWVANDRIRVVTQESYTCAGPNKENTWFIFPIKAPSIPGTYHARFTIYHETAGYLEDTPSAHFIVQVPSTPGAIVLDLSFNNDIFYPGDTKESYIHVAGTGHTVNTYLEIESPYGEKWYAYYPDGFSSPATRLSFTKNKYDITCEEWEMHPTTWHFNSYTFSESDVPGVWTWRVWYEEVGVPGVRLAFDEATYVFNPYPPGMGSGGGGWRLCKAFSTMEDPVYGEAPLTVDFSGFDFSPDIVGWYWNFGDGSASYEQNPTHTYYSPGVYDVTLTVISGGGTSNSTTYEDYVTVTSPDTIPPVLTLLSPLGGELFIGDSTEIVEWTASDESGIQNVDIFYNVGGSFLDEFTLIGSDPSNTGNMNWVIPDTNSTTAYIKIVAYDNHGNFSEAISDSYFTILRVFETWKLGLTANCGFLSDTGNYAGMHSWAEDGFDWEYDVPEPPDPWGESYVNLYFNHPEWSVPLGDKFRNDYRELKNLEDTAYVWKFEVAKNSTEDSINIEMSSIGEVPPEYGIFLIDLDANGFMKDWRADPSPYSCAIESDEGTRHFMLIIGTSILYQYDPGWNMVSVPIDPSPSSPHSVYGDDVSPFWLYDYLTSYFAATNVKIGEGYWLGTLDTQNYIIDVEGDVPTYPVKVPLNYGANIVGCPSIESISWDDIRIKHSGSYYTSDAAEASGLIQKILYGYIYGGYRISQHFNPWRGFWMACLTEDPCTLVYNDSYFFMRSATFSTTFDSIWTIPLIVEISGSEIIDATTYFGIALDATDAFDPMYDYFSPPTPPSGVSYVEAYFPHPEWSLPFEDKFNCDIKAYFTPVSEKVWSFEVKSSEDYEDIVVSWSPGLPHGYTFDLTDITGGYISRDMRSVSSYSFTSGSSGSVREFEIGVISVDVDEEENKKLPKSFYLSQNVPNPFNSSTELEFGLPVSANTDVSIYNIMGEKVDLLVNETLTAGIYKVKWDASEQPTGIYFARIKAGDYTETKRIICLK